MPEHLDLMYNLHVSDHHTLKRRTGEVEGSSLFSLFFIIPAGLSNLYTLNVEKNFRKERYLRDHFDETFQCINEIGCNVAISDIFKNCKI